MKRILKNNKAEVWFYTTSEGTEQWQLIAETPIGTVDHVYDTYEQAYSQAQLVSESNGFENLQLAVDEERIILKPKGGVL